MRGALPLLGKPLRRNSSNRAVLTAVGLLSQRVELLLEVEVVSEAAPGLEVLLQVVVLALKLPLGLTVAGVENDPADLQLAAERKGRLGRPPAARDRGLPVPDQLLRAHTKPAEVPRQTPENVRRLLGEHERASERARRTRLAVP